MKRNFEVGDKVQSYMRTLTDFSDNSIDKNLYLYEIMAFATDTTSYEMVVVYKALYKDAYGNYRVWTMPYSDFMDETNKSAFPDCKQEYKFELYQEGI